MLALGVEKQKARERDALRARELRLRERERGFNSRLPATEKPLDDYNALFDKNLRGYFASPKIQRLFIEHGLVDAEGNVIDVDRNKAKLLIIEQELRDAERAEWLRVKTELEADRQRKLARVRDRERRKHMEVVRERVMERRERRLEQKAQRDLIAPRTFNRGGYAERPGSSASQRSRARRDPVDAMPPEQVQAELSETLRRIGNSY